MTFHKIFTKFLLAALLHVKVCLAAEYGKIFQLSQFHEEWKALCFLKMPGETNECPRFPVCRVDEEIADDGFFNVSINLHGPLSKHVATFFNALPFMCSEGEYSAKGDHANSSPQFQELIEYLYIYFYEHTFIKPKAKIPSLVSSLFMPLMRSFANTISIASSNCIDEIFIECHRPNRDVIDDNQGMAEYENALDQIMHSMLQDGTLISKVKSLVLLTSTDKDWQYFVNCKNGNSLNKYANLTYLHVVVPTSFEYFSDNSAVYKELQSMLINSSLTIESLKLKELNLDSIEITHIAERLKNMRNLKTFTMILASISRPILLEEYSVFKEILADLGITDFSIPEPNIVDVLPMKSYEQFSVVVPFSPRPSFKAICRSNRTSVFIKRYFPHQMDPYFHKWKIGALEKLKDNPLFVHLQLISVINRITYLIFDYVQGNAISSFRTLPEQNDVMRVAKQLLLAGEAMDNAHLDDYILTAKKIIIIEDYKVKIIGFDAALVFDDEDLEDLEIEKPSSRLSQIGLIMWEWIYHNRSVNEGFPEKESQDEGDNILQEFLNDCLFVEKAQWTLQEWKDRFSKY